MQKVNFKNRDYDIAAHLYQPPHFHAGKKYPALICAHPVSSCKEQTAAIYAEKMAQAGYVVLAFDAATQGESGGRPRYLEEPGLRVEDFRCAADYLVTLDYVDEERIGVLGICGGGGYAANAAMTERRIKAVGTVVTANIGRIMREGDMSADNAIKTLEAIAKQRTAEARGGAPLYVGYIPDSQEEREKAGLTDIDVKEAVDYYKTPRGQKPGAPCKARFVSFAATMAFDAFHLAEHLLTQPLQIIVGSKPGSFGSYRDGYELYSRAASKHKNLFIIEGASHYDLYDRPFAVDKAVEKLKDFYQTYL